MRESDAAELAAILDSALDAVIRMDSRGVITGWHAQAEATFGWTAVEAVGRTLADTIIPPQHREGHARGLERFLATGVGPILNRRIEITGLNRDGREFPVELTVSPIRMGDAWNFTAFVRDLSARKAAEDTLQKTTERLRESETHYRLLFESNPEAMWVYDTETLGFLTVNEAAVRRYGYSREEFLRLTIRDIRTPAEHPALEEMLSKSVGETFHANVCHRRKDGREIDVEIVSDDLVFGGRPGRLVLARDMTERRQLERQLRQAQKMEAVGQLAGGIAHDFNNLLTAILGSTEILLEDLPADHPHREEANDCRKAALRAADLTRQLLAFGRRQVLAPRVLHLNEVVADMDKMLRRVIGEDIDLTNALAPDLGAVRADPGQLEQVLVNLAVNARDAMPEGGKLTITTAAAVFDESTPAEDTGIAPGAYVMLAVTDTGVGMDAATQPRVFEPFFTTKPTGKGTGLGLATVYGIVKQSGGTIQVVSAPGNGTTFRIYLPRLEDAAAPRPADAAPLTSLGGSETVLLAEDQEEVRVVTHKLLRARGYTVLVAASGAEALGVAERHQGRIDLLITDVVMPAMSGRELSRRLLSTQAGMKVLFISGYPDDSILHQGTLDPGVAFLQKPFSSQGLARRVREVLEAR